jgi:alpha-glucosidase (family GH31 glycosyl hydrolase)
MTTRVKRTSTEFDPYYVSIPFFYHQSYPRGTMAASFVDNAYRGGYEFSHAEEYHVHFSGGQYTEYIFAGPGVTARQVYLPEGSWYEWHSDALIGGKRYVHTATLMERIPVYARGGAVIPMWPDAPPSTAGSRLPSSSTCSSPLPTVPTTRSCRKTMGSPWQARMAPATALTSR